MSEDTKKSNGGALVVKTDSDDGKPTQPVSQSVKRIIIKSADMKNEMQQEAVDIAIAVVFPSFNTSFFF